jgi:ribonuclease HII
MWAYERKAVRSGFSSIAGIDEAGRGPLAGPVVSAAVILPPDLDPDGITDSKKLTPPKRERLYNLVMDRALSVGIGVVSAAQIDRINILKAALQSMALAAADLDQKPDFLLVDGKFEIPAVIPQQAIVRGDSKSISIAAASIVAKVIRDRQMTGFHRQFPQFGFQQHKGYPTRAHREAIRKHGICPIHRRTFKGVKEYI